VCDVIFGLFLINDFSEWSWSLIFVFILEWLLSDIKNLSRNWQWYWCL